MDLGPKIGPIIQKWPWHAVHIVSGSSRDEGFSRCLVTRSLKCFSLPLCWFHLTFKNTSFPRSVQFRSFLLFLITGLVLFVVILIASLFSISKPNSVETFFRRIRQKGSENNKDIINGEKIKKEFQFGIKNSYRQTLTL